MCVVDLTGVSWLSFIALSQGALIGTGAPDAHRHGARGTRGTVARRDRGRSSSIAAATARSVSLEATTFRLSTVVHVMRQRRAIAASVIVDVHPLHLARRAATARPPRVSSVVSMRASARGLPDRGHGRCSPGDWPIRIAIDMIFRQKDKSSALHAQVAPRRHPRQGVGGSSAVKLFAELRDDHFARAFEADLHHIPEGLAKCKDQVGTED